MMDRRYVPSYLVVSGRFSILTRKIVADVVIGADGVRSKARELVLGYFDKPKSSGYAVYRAW